MITSLGVILDTDGVLKRKLFLNLLSIFCSASSYKQLTQRFYFLEM